MTDITAADGTEVVLTCAVSGNPAPHVSWFHNGKNIDKSTDFAISFNDHTGVGELVIVDCMNDDQGRFKCVATNQVGSAESECQLTVTPPQKPVPDVAKVEQVVAAETASTVSQAVEVKEEVVVPVHLEGKVVHQQAAAVVPESPPVQIDVQIQSQPVTQITAVPVVEETSRTSDRSETERNPVVR